MSEMIRFYNDKEKIEIEIASKILASKSEGSITIGEAKILLGDEYRDTGNETVNRHQSNKISSILALEKARALIKEWERK